MPCCPICRGSRPILDCHDVLIGTIFMSPPAFVSFDCPVSGCRYEARGGRRLRGHSQLPNSLVLEPHEHRDANLTFVTPIVILAPFTWGSRASRRKAMICDELSTLPRLDFSQGATRPTIIARCTKYYYQPSTCNIVASTTSWITTGIHGGAVAHANDALGINSRSNLSGRTHACGNGLNRRFIGNGVTMGIRSTR